MTVQVLSSSLVCCAWMDESLRQSSHKYTYTAALTTAAHSLIGWVNEPTSARLTGIGSEHRSNPSTGLRRSMDLTNVFRPRVILWGRSCGDCISPWAQRCWLDNPQTTCSQIMWKTDSSDIHTVIFFAGRLCGFSDAKVDITLLDKLLKRWIQYNTKKSVSEFPKGEKKIACRKIRKRFQICHHSLSC